MVTQFAIVKISDHQDRGRLIYAKHLGDLHDFAIEKNATLGGVPVFESPDRLPSAVFVFRPLRKIPFWYFWEGQIVELITGIQQARAQGVSVAGNSVLAEPGSTFPNPNRRRFTFSRSGKIKALIVSLVGLVDLVWLKAAPAKGDLFFPCLSALITGIVGVFVTSSLKSGLARARLAKISYRRPSWNDKIAIRNGLSTWLFFAILFIIGGLCSLIKTGIIFGGISEMGAVSLSLGLAILAATYLSYFLFNAKPNAET